MRTFEESLERYRLAAKHFWDQLEWQHGDFMPSGDRFDMRDLLEHTSREDFHKAAKCAAAIIDYNHVIRMNNDLIRIGIDPPGWDEVEWAILAEALDLPPTEPVNKEKVCRKAIGRSRLEDARDRRRGVKDIKGHEQEPLPKEFEDKSGKPSSDLLSDIRVTIETAGMPLFGNEIISRMGREGKPGKLPANFCWMARNGHLINIEGWGYWLANRPIPE